MKYITMLVSITSKLVFSAVFVLTFCVLALTIGGIAYGALVEAGYIERSIEE